MPVPTAAGQEAATNQEAATGGRASGSGTPPAGGVAAIFRRRFWFLRNDESHALAERAQHADKIPLAAGLTRLLLAAQLDPPAPTLPAKDAHLTTECLDRG